MCSKKRTHPFPLFGARQRSTAVDLLVATDGHVGACPARRCPRETRQSAPGWWVRKMSTPWVHSRERQGQCTGEKKRQSPWSLISAISIVGKRCSAPRPVIRVSLAVSPQLEPFLWNEHARCRVDSKPPTRTPHMAKLGGGGPGLRSPHRGRLRDEVPSVRRSSARAAVFGRDALTCSRWEALMSAYHFRQERAALRCHYPMLPSSTIASWFQALR